MAKYHINKAGEPKVCRAIFKCPFGSKEEHHDTPEAARDAYEKEMTAEVVPEGASKKTLTRSDIDRIVLDLSRGVDLLDADQ